MLDCGNRFASRMAAPKNRKSPSLTAKALRRRITRAVVVTTRGKKVKGRKRHILVDTLGLLLTCIVHPASVQDRDGAKWVLARATFDFERLRIVRADGGYAGKLVNWTKQNCRWTVDIIRRTSAGFVVLPKRWVVERTFAWLSKSRRLSKDYEILEQSSEAFVYLTMISLMLKRLN